jgi:signal transduction histidine kinase
VVAVSDDGVGGAVEKTGHGLAGLRDRATGMGGTFALSSPDGGPTEVRVTLPLAGVSDASGAAANGAASTTTAAAKRATPKRSGTTSKRAGTTPTA